MGGTAGNRNQITNITTQRNRIQTRTPAITPSPLSTMTSLCINQREDDTPSPTQESFRPRHIVSMKYIEFVTVIVGCASKLIFYLI